MMDIKPIETVYNGYRFRSRLEARWAVFFDAAGIKYEYEPEGFKAEDGTMYLPDFYLTNKHCWVEVKSNYDKLISEKHKLDSILLSDNTPIGRDGLMILGPIPDQYTNLSGIEPYYSIPFFLFYRRVNDSYDQDGETRVAYHHAVQLSFKCFLRHKGVTWLINPNFMCHTADDDDGIPDIVAESIMHCGENNKIQELLTSQLCLNGYPVACECDSFPITSYHLPVTIAKETYDYFQPCFAKARQARFEHGEYPT